ncbi:YnbE family lipoprotein [Caulobacter sp. 17J80-11]
MAAGAGAVLVSACAPTIHVKVDPITIYAKLDADVRIRLDDEVKALIKQNPDLF